MLPTEDAEPLPVLLRDQWGAIECVLEGDSRAPQFWFVTGRPYRVSVGSVGEKRFPGMCPHRRPKLCGE